MLELKDKVARERDPRTTTKFGKLTDPPTLADAIFGAIVSSLVGLIPGGAIIKAGLTAGIFALDMRKLQKDLTVMPIPGVSAEDEKAKGPTAQHTGKSEKLYERGKTAVDIGGKVVNAVKETKKKQEEAAAAEKRRRRSSPAWRAVASPTGRRRSRTPNARRSRSSMAARARPSGMRGGLEAAVRTYLGPIPEVSEEFQKALGRSTSSSSTARSTRARSGRRSITHGRVLHLQVIEARGRSAAEQGDQAEDRRARRPAAHVGAPRHDRDRSSSSRTRSADVKLDSSGHLKGGMKF